MNDGMPSFLGNAAVLVCRALVCRIVFLHTTVNVCHVMLMTVVSNPVFTFFHDFPFSHSPLFPLLPLSLPLSPPLPRPYLTSMPSTRTSTLPYSALPSKATLMWW